MLGYSRVQDDILIIYVLLLLLLFYSHLNLILTAK